MRNIIVSAPAPFHTLSIQCDSTRHALEDINAALYALLPTTLLSVCSLYPSFRTSSSSSSSSLSSSSSSSTLSSTSTSVASLDVHYLLRPRFLGGKGGFGSQLRAAGTRKSSSKSTTRASMKDTQGRKLRTVQRAESLALALRDLPARERAARAAKREELERVLGREMIQNKFDDEEYLATCEAVIQDVKSAMKMSFGDGKDDVDDDDDDDEVAQLDEIDGDASAGPSSSVQNRDARARPRAVQGWDEDDDALSGSSSNSSEDEDEQSRMPAERIEDAKGKGKAAANVRASKKRKL